MKENYMIDLRQLKIDLQLTQGKLAEVLECSQGYVSVIERKKTISEMQLSRLIANYGEENVMKYVYEPNNYSEVNIGNHYGNNGNIDNSPFVGNDTMQIINDYRLMIEELRQDKIELRKQIEALKAKLEEKERT